MLRITMDQLNIGARMGSLITENHIRIDFPQYSHPEYLKDCVLR